MTDVNTSTESNTRKLTFLKSAYLALAIIGFVGTMYFNWKYYEQNGKAFLGWLDPVDWFKDGFFNPDGSLNPAGSFLSFEAYVLTFMGMIWMWVECQRMKMKYYYLYVVATLLIGISFAYPFFLFIREKKRSTIKESTGE